MERFMNRFKWLLLSIIVLILITCGYFIVTKISHLKNELQVKDIKEQELTLKLNEASENLTKSLHVIKIYDNKLLDLGKIIKAPIHDYEGKDQVIAEKGKAFIEKNLDPKKHMLIKIGPITKDPDNTYFINYYIYTKLDEDNLLEQVTGNMPPETISHHLIKYKNNSFENIQ